MPAAVGLVGGLFGFGTTAMAIGGAGAVMGAWVGGGIAASAIGGLAVKLMTTVALSALASALAPDPPQGGGLTISATVRGEQNPETIILGRYATGGQAICAPYSHGSSNRYLTHVIELCSAPGAALSRMMIGDDWVELGSTPHADYGYPVQGDYNGLIWVKYYDGRQVSADPMLRNRYGNHPDRPWTVEMTGKGICYAILTFRYDQEKLPQVPRYRFEMQGLPLYDIRQDTSAGGQGNQRLDTPATWQPTDNAIVIAWNLMRGIPLPGGEVYGGNITDLRRLPAPVWISAMNACDVTIPLDGGESEPAYRAGLEIALDSPPAAALEEVFKACSATVADLGYGWGVVAGAPGLPVWICGDDDVIVSRSQQLDPFPGLQDTYNAVTAKFPDPEHYWETKEAPQRTNALWEAADAFGRRSASLALPAVPYALQVQRLMRAWIEDERRFRRHIINLPPNTAHVELTDTISWNSVSNGYDGKDFTVHEIYEDPRTRIRQMSIRERNPLDYNWQPSFTLPWAPSAPIPTPLPPQQVSGFDARAINQPGADGEPRLAGIQLLWSEDLIAQGLRWEIRLKNAPDAHLQGDLQDLTKGSVAIYEGILPETEYEIRARLIANYTTVWTGWITVLTNKAGISWADLAQQMRDILEQQFEKADQAAADAQEAYDLADHLRTDLDTVSDTLLTDIDAVRQSVTDIGQTVAGNTGAINSEAMTRALEDAALAGLITTVSTSVGDLAATVTTQATAITDLQDGARVGYLIKVQAGGAVSLLDLIAADGSGAQPTSIARIKATDILLEGSVSASLLVIHDGSGNMVPDPQFATMGLASWEPRGIGATEIYPILRADIPGVTPRNAAPSGTVLFIRNHLGAGNAWLAGPSFGAEVGEVFNLSFDAAVAQNGLHMLQLRLAWLDAEGNGLGYGTCSISDAPAGWTGAAATVEAPENTAAARMDFVSYDTPTMSGWAVVTNLSVIRKRSGATLITPESITTGLLAAEAVTADKVAARAIGTVHLYIDERLEISDRNAGFAFGKQSLLDLNPGMFAGVGNTANSFGINISREGTGGVPQQLIMTEDEGLRILNAKHVVTAGSLGRATMVETSQTIVLPTGSTTLTMTIVGGGAGGAGGAPFGTRYPTRAGTASIVELYDGSTLMHTWTAAGAAGGYLPADTTNSYGTVYNYRGPGAPSPFAAGGTWASYSGHGDNDIGAYEYGRNGSLGSGGAGRGAAGSVVQVTDFDISGLANPRLVFTRGAGGPRVGAPAGRSYSGGKGGDGAFQYQVKTYGEVPADVVPLIPTAFGSFSKPANATGPNVFPDLGPGLWILSTNNNDNLDIGQAVEVTTLSHTIRLVASNTATFFADKRPDIITGWNTPRTIQYLFYRMGNWG